MASLFGPPCISELSLVSVLWVMMEDKRMEGYGRLCETWQCLSFFHSKIVNLPVPQLHLTEWLQSDFVWQTNSAFVLQVKSLHFPSASNKAQNITSLVDGGIFFTTSSVYRKWSTNNTYISVLDALAEVCADTQRHTGGPQPWSQLLNGICLWQDRRPKLLNVLCNSKPLWLWHRRWCYRLYSKQFIMSYIRITGR